MYIYGNLYSCWTVYFNYSCRNLLNRASWLAVVILGEFPSTRILNLQVSLFPLWNRNLLLFIALDHATAAIRERLVEIRGVAMTFLLRAMTSLCYMMNKWTIQFNLCVCQVLSNKFSYICSNYVFYFSFFLFASIIRFGRFNLFYVIFLKLLIKIFINK